MSKRSGVLYHYPCPDGVFAALAVHLYFSATKIYVLFFPNTVYSPLRVIVLDHHKTALELLSNSTFGENVFQVIDMERSRATISHDFFREKIISENINKGYDSVISEYDHIRPLFEYIQDGDLWKWRLCDSKAFSSGLKDLNIEYDPNLNPSLFDQSRALDLNLVIGQGTESLSNKQQLINVVLERCYEIALGGGAFGCCLIIDANSIAKLRSELGHQLANKSQLAKLRAIGAVVYTVPELGNNSMLKISLRSVEDEDTTPISQAFGGGGHRNASSFMLSTSEFEKWKI